MADFDGMVTVHESWIFAMITLGFIGSIALIFLIVIATYHTYHKQLLPLQTKSDQLKIIVNYTLTFGIWIFSACACLEWAFLRTDLFIELDRTNCTAIYISNYLFYLLSKLCLHLLLLFRLYLAFNGTALYINNTLLRLFALLICIDFIVFVSLWLDICLKKVSVGVVIPSRTITFCTLYNNSSASHMTVYEKIWPMLFGAQDFVVGILTLAVFIHKLNQLSQFSHDPAMDALVRKLFVMGSTSICSTFVLFTFAVPFYSNLTFLLPLDALVNGVCVVLLLEWTNLFYLKVCCGMELCLQSILKRETTTTGTSDKSNVIISPFTRDFKLNSDDSDNKANIQCRSAPHACYDEAVTLSVPYAFNAPRCITSSKSTPLQ